jgi:hypothetical protein
MCKSEYFWGSAHALRRSLAPTPDFSTESRMFSLQDSFSSQLSASIVKTFNSSTRIGPIVQQRIQKAFSRFAARPPVRLRPKKSGTFERCGVASGTANPFCIKASPLGPSRSPRLFSLPPVRPTPSPVFQFLCKANFIIGPSPIFEHCIVLLLFPFHPPLNALPHL